MKRGRTSDMAFCRIAYETKSGVREYVWNSRDAGVPMSIFESTTGDKADFVEGQTCECMPDYVPKLGERIFTELTESRARCIAANIIDDAEKNFSPEKLAELQAKFPTRDEAVDDLTRVLLSDGLGVDIVHVTSAMLENWKAPATIAPPTQGHTTGEDVDYVEIVHLDGVGIVARMRHINTETTRFFDRKGAQIAFEEFHKLCCDETYSEMASTNVGDHIVLTYWSGIVNDDSPPPHQIFETVVFLNRKTRKNFRRSTSEEDAFRAHAELVRFLTQRVSTKGVN